MSDDSSTEQVMAQRIAKLLEGEVNEEECTKEWVTKLRTLQRSVRDDVLTGEYGIGSDDERGKAVWRQWLDVKGQVLAQQTRLRVSSEIDGRRQQLQALGQQIAREAHSQGFERNIHESDGSYQLDLFLSAGTAQFRKLSQAWTQSGNGLDSHGFTVLLGNIVDLTDEELYRQFCKIDADDDGSLTWGEYLAYLHREVIFGSKLVDTKSNVAGGSGPSLHTSFVEEDIATRRISSESRVTVRSMSMLGSFGYGDMGSTVVASCSDNSISLWNMNTFSSVGIVNTSGLADLARDYFATAVGNNKTSSNGSNSEPRALFKSNFRKDTSIRHKNTRLQEKLAPTNIPQDFDPLEPLTAQSTSSYMNSLRVHMAETHRHIVSLSKSAQNHTVKKPSHSVYDEQALHAAALKRAQGKFFGRAGGATDEAESAPSENRPQRVHKARVSSRDLQPHTAVCWHAAHRKLVVAGVDGFIYLQKHDAHLGFVLADVFYTQATAITCVAAVHTALAVGTAAGTITLYCMDREGQKAGLWAEGVLGVATPRWQNSLHGQVLGVIEGSPGLPVRKIEFMPHTGLVFAQSSAVYRVPLHDLSAVTPVVTQQEMSSEVGIQSFALSRRAVVAAADISVVVCDVSTRSSKHVFLPYNGFGKVLHLTVIESSNQLVVVSDDKKIRLYDLSTYVLLQTLSDAAVYAPVNVYTAVAYDVFSKRLVTAGCALKLWRLASAQSGSSHEAAVVYTAFSKEFNQVVTVGADKSVNLWSLRSLKSTLHYKVELDQGSVAVGDITITGACTDIKGRKLIIVALNSRNESKLYMWNLNSGLLLGELQQVAGELSSCICVPGQETTQFAASVEAGVHRISMEDDVDTLLFNAEEASVLASADNWLLSGSGSGASVWHGDSGKLQFLIELGSAQPSGLAVAHVAAGKLGICAAYDQSLSFFLLRPSAGVLTLKRAFPGYCSKVTALIYHKNTRQWDGFSADHKCPGFDPQQPFDVPERYLTCSGDYCMFLLLVSDNISSVYLVDLPLIEKTLGTTSAITTLDCACQYLQLVRRTTIDTTFGLIMTVAPVPSLASFVLGTGSGEVLLMSYHGLQVTVMRSDYASENVMDTLFTTLKQAPQPFDSQHALAELAKERPSCGVVSPYANGRVCPTCLYNLVEGSSPCNCAPTDAFDDTPFYITEETTQTSRCHCFAPNLSMLNEPQLQAFCDVAAAKPMEPVISTTATRQRMANEVRKSLYGDGIYAQPEYRMQLVSSRYDVDLASAHSIAREAHSAHSARPVDEMALSLKWPTVLQRSLPTLNKITQHYDQLNEDVDTPTILAQGPAPQNILSL